MTNLYSEYDAILNGIPDLDPYDRIKFSQSPSGEDKQLFSDKTGRPWHSAHHHLELFSANILEAMMMRKVELKVLGFDYIVRALPHPTLNAEVKRYGASYLVLFNEGLTTFFHLFLKIVLQSEDFQSELFGNKNKMSHVTKEDEIDLLARLYHFFLDHQNSEPLSKINSLPLERSTALVYQSMAQEILTFIIAHEFAHIVRGHFLPQDVKNTTGVLGGADFNSHPVTQEVDADTTAALAMFLSGRKAGYPGTVINKTNAFYYTQIMLSSILLFFYAFHFLSAILGRPVYIDNPRLVDDMVHPPPIDRFNLVLQRLEMNGNVHGLSEKDIGITHKFIEHFYEMDALIKKRYTEIKINR